VTSNQDGIEEFYEIFRTASEHIASSEVPEGFSALWQRQINFDRHQTLTRLLLALLPHLENVSVSDETHHGVWSDDDYGSGDDLGSGDGLGPENGLGLEDGLSPEDGLGLVGRRTRVIDPASLPDLLPARP
jgi:hypothetical protein